MLVAGFLVSASVLDFGSIEEQKLLTITNNGNGVLEWKADKKEAWLTFEPTSGKVDAGRSSTITVKVSRTNLKAGSYTDTIVFSSNVGERRTAVNMSVAGLSYTLRSYNFGASQTRSTLTITNTGAGSLSWSVTKTQSWLTISPASGFVSAGESATASVVVSRTGLNPGTYNDTISLKTNGGNAEIPVRMDVAGLSYTPEAFNFNASETTKTLTISNTGGGSLNWQASKKQSWLTINPVSGSVSADASASVTVSVSTADLKPGDYTDTISLTSNGGNANIPVTLSIPQLTIVTNFVSFGASETQKSFAISNTGGGNLLWQVSTKEPWLTLNPKSGSISAGQSINVTATVSRNNMLPGFYTDKAVFTSNGGSKNVDIFMSVAGLSVTPTNLAFSANETQKTLAIANTGAGTLTWQATDDSQWLTVNPTSGSVEPNSPTNVTVTVSRTGLNPGTYTGAIVFTSNGGNVTVPVSMIVASPTISINPESLNFGARTTSATFQVLNIGAGTLNWSITPTSVPQWASISPMSGATIAGTPTTVTVTVSRQNLASGTYNASIAITSNGGNATLRLTMTVADPILNVNPDTISFGTTTSQSSFDVINSGGGVLNWNIDRSLPTWLSIKPISGSTAPDNPTQVTVIVDRTVVAPGDYTHDLRVSSLSDNSTKIVRITMTVPRPTLRVSPTSINFGQTATTRTLDIINDGGGVLSWTATSSSAQNWLYIEELGVEELDGISRAYSSSRINIVIHRDLAPGTYTGVINVDSNGNPTKFARIVVTMTVPGEIILFNE